MNTNEVEDINLSFFDKPINVYISGGFHKNAVDFLNAKITIVDNVGDADIVFFTAGEDVNPSLYESKNLASKINLERDMIDISTYILARSMNKFIIGICRGAQLVSVLNGCSIIQDASGHQKDHNVKFYDSNNEIVVNSCHHQLINLPYSDENKSFIIAHSKSSNQKKFIYYGTLPKDFVEIESVFFEKTNSLAIQPDLSLMKKTSNAVLKMNTIIFELYENHKSNDNVDLHGFLGNSVDSSYVYYAIANSINETKEKLRYTSAIYDAIISGKRDSMISLILSTNSRVKKLLMNPIVTTDELLGGGFSVLQPQGIVNMEVDQQRPTSNNNLSYNNLSTRTIEEALQGINSSIHRNITNF